MEIIHQYDLQEKVWQHSVKSEALGHYQSPSPLYGLGLSPQDHNNKTGYYFNVSIEKKFSNETGVFFLANTLSVFLVSIADTDTPTPEDLFSLVQKATDTFGNLFRSKTLGTTLQLQTIENPDFQLLQKDLTKLIADWKHIRYLSHS